MARVTLNMREQARAPRREHQPEGSGDPRQTVKVGGALHSIQSADGIQGITFQVDGEVVGIGKKKRDSPE
eukprot:3402861-Pyramimonas_sp.AAC.1